MGTGTPTTMWQLTMAALSVSMPHELSIQSKLSRRTHLLSSSMAALALLPCKQAMAVSARTGLSSVFTGEYEDPKHPGCLRSIKVEGAKMGPDGRRSRKPTATVKGVDGDACSEPPALSDVWKVVGEVNELPPSKGSGDDQPDPTIKVDFSPKGGPTIVGTWEELGSIGKIKFTDGNSWTKIPGGTPERRPKNLPTLSSD